MRRQRLAVIGWGRLGRDCAAALHERPELELALVGIVRRADSLAAAPRSPVAGVPCVSHVSELGEIDAALLCVPAEAAAGVARELLQARAPVV